MEPLAIPYQDNATVLLVIVEIRVRRLAKRVPMETDASRFVYAKMVQSAIQLMALVTALEIGQENTAMKRRRVAPNGSSCLVASVPHATAIRTMLSGILVLLTIEHVRYCMVTSITDPSYLTRTI
jgi:hypothetical protein